MPLVAPLPAGTHVLHLGPSKTGSTTLQAHLHNRREELPQWGVGFPSAGSTRARHAGWWILGLGAAIGRRPATQQDWDDYAAEVAATDQPRVMVSNEEFALANDEAAAAIVRDLGGAKPHIVYVVRNLDRYLPSAYQERVKAGDSRPYHAWLQASLGDDPTYAGGRDHLWKSHELDAILDRWVPLVGAENFTLVISDDHDRTLMPTAFSHLLGLPEDFFLGSDSNQSLSWSASEALRAFNRRWVHAGRDGSAYHAFVQNGIVRGVRDIPAATEKVSFPALPTWARDLLSVRAQAQHDAVLRAQNDGVRVIGNPESLLTIRPADDTTVAPSTLAVEEAAAMMFAQYEAAVGRESRQAERTAQRVARLKAKANTQTAPAGRIVEETPASDLLRAVAGRVKRRLLGR